MSAPTAYIRAVAPPAQRVRVIWTRPGADAAPHEHTGHSFLIWDESDCAWLRGRGRVSATPIGSCMLRTATRGKAAAVPMLLSPEELYVCLRNEWVAVVDSLTGHTVDAWRDYLLPLGRRDAAHVRRRSALYDLWMRGYRCTAGMKFGVDYLTYTSDPSVVHAAYMLIVARKGELMSPMEMLSRARVATTSLKICVVAYVEEVPALLEDLHAKVAVTYAAFRRMGPGSAVFLTASALLDKAAAALREHERSALDAALAISMEDAAVPRQGGGDDEMA